MPPQNVTLLARPDCRAPRWRQSPERLNAIVNGFGRAPPARLRFCNDRFRDRPRRDPRTAHRRIVRQRPDLAGVGLAENTSATLVEPVTEFVRPVAATGVNSTPGLSVDDAVEGNYYGRSSACSRYEDLGIGVPRSSTPSFAALAAGAAERPRRLHR